MRRLLVVLGASASLIALAPSAQASETTTYKYDAKGRLKKVTRTRTTGGTYTTDYTHDKADNRKKVKTTFP